MYSTSLEYQVLDEIRRKLNLGERAMEAPAFEVDSDTGDYIRLKARRRYRRRRNIFCRKPRILIIQDLQAHLYLRQLVTFLQYQIKHLPYHDLILII